MSRLRQVRGFALIMAVFLIVTLAAVGVYLVTVSTGQVQATAQDVAATRAYHAARSGLEWGIYQVLQNANPTCAGSPIVFSSLATPPPHLAGFRAVVTCTLVGTETEGAPPAINVYRIVSRGCNANPCTPATPGPTYVERELQVTVTQ
jgi:MSHA biogenesis protein MshP